MQRESFPIFAAIVNAVHRGVKVRLVTNDFGDKTCEGEVTPTDYFALVGAKVRFYASTTFMHAKYLAVGPGGGAGSSLA